MKKRALFRCILGAPLGLALSYVITVFISLTVNDGSYYAVVPELIIGLRQRNGSCAVADGFIAYLWRCMGGRIGNLGNGRMEHFKADHASSGSMLHCNVSNRVFYPMDEP